MIQTEITIKKAPAYCFKKLDCYLAISTVTGDFYDVSEDTYTALTKWNDEIVLSIDSITAEQVREMAERYRIPKNIYEKFPLYNAEEKIHDHSHTITHMTDLTLNITSQCNLQCIYCWNDRGKYSNTTFQKDNQQLHHSRENMTPRVAKKAVDILVALCKEDRNLVVDFYGGEPLENLDTLLETVDYCRDNEKRWNVHFHFLLATNGTLLTPSVAKVLIEKGVQIAISIDGHQQIHDHNRPYANGDGSYHCIQENLNAMPKEILKRLVGRTTVTPYYADMCALYAHLKDLGFERIELFESEDACHMVTPQREAVFFHTLEQYQMLCDEYEKLSLLYIDEILNGTLDYRKTFFNRFFKLMQRLYYGDELSGGCPAARGQIAVSSTGDIYACTAFIGIDKFKLGNITEGVDKVLFNNFIDIIDRRFDYCQKCDLFAICRTTGSCLNMNYYFNENPAIPYQRGCELFREKLQLAIASLAILKEKIPDQLEALFGYDPVGKRGNELY